MGKKAFILFFLLLKLAARADQPGPAYQYDLYSQNGQFYYKSIPFHNYDQTNLGNTIVYETKTKKELYRVGNYLPHSAFIANNGKILITTRFWLWGHSKFENQPLVEFYVNGKKSKQYFVKDLVVNRPLGLVQTTSHTLWYENMFINNDTLFVWLLDRQVLLIDVNTTAILGRKKLSFIEGRFDMKRLPKLRSVVYDKIKYPEEGQFPNLADGREFHPAFIRDFKKREVKSYDSARFYISVSGVIDRKGNCTIFHISTSVDRKEDAAWEKQVVAWVTRQRYRTNLIPVNCDKWVFEDYFYLN